MIPYAFIILLVVFFSVFDFSNLNVFKKKILLFFLSFILILFVGTRLETGDDWGEYTKVFDKIPLVSDLWNDNGMFLLFRMEPGYILFNSVIKSFGGSINEVFLLSSIVVISLFFVFQKRYTLLPFLAVLLYMRYGYMQFNMMFVRQGIAISIFFYSLKYIEDKKIIKYLLINILSSLFHSSLLIVLPLYFVINRRYSNIFLCTVVFISVLLSFFDWMGAILSFFPPFIQSSLTSYTESDVWGGMTGKINIAVAEKFILLLMCLRLREKLEQKNISFNLVFNLFVLSIICYYAFFQTYVFQQRTVLIFQLSTIFIISQLFLFFSVKNRMMVLFILNLMVIYFFFRYINIGKDVYLPYRSWLI